MTGASGGRIITFYSYKGGTGRSMAVANLAWVLAANRRRVLIMDWDLEAPGLHRYFHPFLADKELASTRGLVDLLADYADQAIQPSEEGESDDWYRELTDLAPYLLGINFAGFPEGGRIDLLPSGRQGPGYAAKLHAFDWDTFYERLGGGSYLEAVKERLRESYDYVLIDSRTGVSDTAGICTVQMPDILVTMFTYNNQSIRGALAVAQSAVDTRRRHYGQFSRETFRVFPVPSRADSAELRKLQLRQAYARRVYTPLLDHLPESEHAGYWAGVEVPYNAYLNYEEILSPLIFNPDDPKLPLASLLRLSRHVTDGDVTRYDLPLSPEQKEQLLQAYEQVDELPARGQATANQAAAPTESPADALLRGADSVLAQLDEGLLWLAKRLLLRLVRLPREQEVPGLKRLLLPVNDLPLEERPLLDRFIQVGVLRLTLATDRGSAMAVEITDDSLLIRWRQLNVWVEAEKAFLEQRDWIQSAWEQWRRAGQSDSLLLATPLTEEAAQLLGTHAPLFTRAQIEFIEVSRDFRRAEEAKREAELVNSSAAPAGASPPPTVLARPRAGRPGWAWAVVGLVVVMLGVSAVRWASIDKLPAYSQPVLPMSTSLTTANTGPEPQATVGDAAKFFNIAGVQSLSVGRVDEAIESFGQALQLHPDNPEVLFNRAHAYQLKKQPGMAIADLRAGLKVQPDRADAQLLLASLLVDSKAKQDAIKEYQQALSLSLNPDQRQKVELALDKLNPAPARPQVYLHINNRADSDFAQSLSAQLKAAGSLVRDVQVLPQSNSADVRYANVADEAVAKRIRGQVEGALTKAGYPQQLELLFIGNKFRNVSRGRIEIWLPRLAPPRPEPDVKAPELPPSLRTPFIPLAPVTQPVSKKFEFNEGSEDCNANFTKIIEFCLDRGAMVRSWDRPVLSNVTCGSALLNPRKVPARPNCIALDAHISGCGDEPKILGCRGRGWLEGGITVHGVLIQSIRVGK